MAPSTLAPSGRLFHVLAAISEFGRDLIRPRVLGGLRQAKSQEVRMGRPRVPIFQNDGFLEQSRKAGKLVGGPGGTTFEAGVVPFRKGW